MQRSHITTTVTTGTLSDAYIEPVTTTEMNEATPRPLFSPMSTGKAYTDLGYQPSAFEEGLKEW